MHGRPAWGPDFSHPNYANPDAPKGGTLVQGVLGTFDSLNPFIVQGLPAVNIRSYVVESLLARGYDEPFTLYGLLADGVETNAARSLVTFTINPAARFSDGKPVTPEDVIFSWQLLRDHGRPNLGIYYSKVAQGGEGRRARRAFRSHRRRRPRAAADPRPDADPRQARDRSRRRSRRRASPPPLGSGPYTVTKVKPGDSVTFTRDPNYWGRDLPINRGSVEFRHHPLRLLPRRQYAFRGVQDAASTTCARRPIPAAGRRLTISRRCAKAAWSRRASPTACRKACRAWCSTRAGRSSPTCACARRSCNCSTSSGSTTLTSSISTDRTASYFDACIPVRARRAGRARASANCSNAFPGVVRPDIMDGTWSPPKTDGSGRDRASLRRAFTLFRAAGYAHQRHRAHPSRQRPALRLRDPHRDPRPGAPGARLSRACSSAPASRRACAMSTPPSSSSAASASIST